MDFKILHYFGGSPEVEGLILNPDLNENKLEDYIPNGAGYRFISCTTDDYWGEIPDNTEFIREL